MQDEADDVSLFREAVKDAKPLKTERLAFQPPSPRPIPKQFIRDERQALADSLSDHYLPPEDIESGEELLYVREGHAPDLVKKLRRGHWVVQAALDLHGLQVDQARTATAEFLAACKKQGLRCVRIIHGKGYGSKNREPVLKNKLRSWLMQRDEVIAYAQALREDGGSGAVIVLLKAAR